jgi:hypothetical protein
MNALPARCPLCGGETYVTKIYCPDCDTTLEGRFTGGGPFGPLNREQLDFVLTFIRCEGKINRMEKEIGLSYPTIRNRLYEIIRLLGFEPGGVDEPAGLSEDARQKILEDLDQGRISAEKAMQLLQEG